MKIAEILGEDAYAKTLAQLKEPKKKPQQDQKDTVKGAIERGNRWYKKAKALATAKIPFA